MRTKSQKQSIYLASHEYLNAKYTMQMHISRHATDESSTPKTLSRQLLSKVGLVKPEGKK